uniref:Thioredoxin domain-containing protein n=1 Tax=viral metagenome TaxID=1070528 RepID=A0A6C0EM34_9ZZZZ
MSKKYLVNVPYLEDSDFNPDNSLKPYVGNGKPVVVMCQGLFCGYCSQAKPAFEQFTHSSNNVIGATLQIDGGPSEKTASKRISMLDKSYRGVPTYLGFGSDGKFQKVHNGGRDLNALRSFAASLN